MNRQEFTSEESMHNHNIVSEHPAGKEHRHGDGRVTRRKAMRLGAALVLAGGGLLGCTDGKKGKSFSVNGGERRALLNPSRFSDPRVRMIYSLAEKYNAVLDKLFCYCHCDRPPFLHKSLLSCYAETHAAR
ncbi:MAG: hypothetical protein V3S64_17605 [bacterium]